MKNYKIAAINGDGIGHEIVPVSVDVLMATAQKFGFTVETQSLPFGAGYYQEHGDFLPADGLDILRGFDAILFGAVGLPAVDDTLPFKLFTNKVRTAFKQYVNYRPVKLLDGIQSPLRTKTQKDIDFIVLRENNEGEFVQNGRWMYPEEAQGFATETNLFTRLGIEKIAHYAFQLARKRRNKVTNVTKSNTLIHTLGYWDKVIGEVAAQYPDVQYGKMYIDAVTASFVLKPEIFDVLLTTNLMGDILSDLCAGLVGGLGVVPGANIGDEVAIFEAVHGTAPDIAGKGIANPTAVLRSAIMMLQYLNENEIAKKIDDALDRTLAVKELCTGDLGGKANIETFTRNVIANI
ncbi:MAG: isocitrate/isopropylmalate dehydrogenase family protein [Saprospiraceae bacterium]|nr:isocitrate/isopropylmalate dehydrogenase family protein [Saprospiraceae bacterium]